VYKPFAKARKRIETTFSQLSDQFMMIRNYAKNFTGFSTRILAKITAFTILQYLNFTQNKPLCKTKYALC
ncbi:MAG: IS982 family transposase, partial [Alistipes sp.]